MPCYESTDFWFALADEAPDELPSPPSSPFIMDVEDLSSRCSSPFELIPAEHDNRSSSPFDDILEGPALRSSSPLDESPPDITTIESSVIGPKLLAHLPPKSRIEQRRILAYERHLQRAAARKPAFQAPSAPGSTGVHGLRPRTGRAPSQQSIFPDRPAPPAPRSPRFRDVKPATAWRRLFSSAPVANPCRPSERTNVHVAIRCVAFRRGTKAPRPSLRPGKSCLKKSATRTSKRQSVWWANVTLVKEFEIAEGNCMDFNAKGRRKVPLSPEVEQLLLEQALLDQTLLEESTGLDDEEEEDY